ncbi:MAG: RluA family pseudouridine synthase [Patescibacteria group bacterium]
MTPTILYEDKNILAINKPAGLVVHGDGKTNEPVLTDWVLENYPETKNVGEPNRDTQGNVILRPGIVHRLDRDTSGVMLVAKTQEAFESLKIQFQEHTIKKTYHAFVLGEVKDHQGVIDRPIGRSNKDFRMWSAQRGARGELRDAVTEYKTLKATKEWSFVEVEPKTGRTHQIRAHFKAIHHPLVADPLYAPKNSQLVGFKRLALHAYSIEFALLDGTVHKVTAPYPEDFARAMDLLQN